MCAYAWAASRRRCSRVNPPAATASAAAGYIAGSVITATCWWFLAAARTMAGPPMSICSTHSAAGAPELTAASNGYRLDTSSPNGAMPSSASLAACPGRPRSASSPACTAGCSVLTRPSRHSGKPVTSSTAVTGTPASAMAAAVLPVLTISTPHLCSAPARSASPVLSYTLISARLMATLVNARSLPSCR